jgi:hypothetical protein
MRLTATLRGAVSRKRGGRVVATSDGRMAGFDSHGPVEAAARGESRNSAVDGTTHGAVIE